MTTPEVMALAGMIAAASVVILIFPWLYGGGAKNFFARYWERRKVQHAGKKDDKQTVKEKPKVEKEPNILFPLGIVFLAGLVLLSFFVPDWFGIFAEWLISREEWQPKWLILVLTIALAFWVESYGHRTFAIVLVLTVAIPLIFLYAATHEKVLPPSARSFVERVFNELQEWVHGVGEEAEYWITCDDPRFAKFGSWVNKQETVDKEFGVCVPPEFNAYFKIVSPGMGELVAVEQQTREIRSGYEIRDERAGKRVWRISTSMGLNSAKAQFYFYRK